jgi:hypothetical protein
VNRLPVLIAAALVAAVYVLRLDNVVGLIVDDAWYVLLARALAQGQGYTMINAPVAGLMPIDPPGFPLLLSLVLRLWPAFPENLLALKSISIVAMAAAGVATFAHLRRFRGLDPARSMLVALATVLTPAFVFLSTSAVMSECVFTLCLLLAAMFIDSIAADDTAGAGTVHTVIGGVLSAAAMLVRSAGVAVPAAGVLLLCYRRKWREAAGFAVAVAITLSPWLLYSRAHRPTAEQQAVHGGAHAMTYRETFWQRWAGDRASGTITLADLPGRIGDNLIDVFGRAVGGVVAPSIFRGADESGQEIVALGGARGFRGGSMGSATSAMLIAFAISAVCAIGYLSAARSPRFPEFFVPVALAIVVLWPHWTFRFVLPLAPFLFFYLASGVEPLARRFARSGSPHAPSRSSRLALLCVLGLSLLDHGQYLVLKLRDSAQVGWIAEAGDVDELLKWMRERLPKDAIVATTNPPLVYLKTGQRTVAIDDPEQNSARWRALGVRYLAALRASDPPNPSVGYAEVYRSSSGLWVLRLSGDERSQGGGPATSVARRKAIR